MGYYFVTYCVSVVVIPPILEINLRDRYLKTRAIYIIHMYVKMFYYNVSELSI